MGKAKIKSTKQLERHFKGVANHWRLQILMLLAEKSNLSLLGISELVGGNLKTIGEHTRRLYLAGLIEKRYQGRMVLHNLSPYGERFVRFVKTFQHS